MKVQKQWMALAMCGMFVSSTYADKQLPPWQSQYAIGLNKLEPHAYVWPYADAQAVVDRDHQSSPYYLSLNGKWRFNWVKNPDNRPVDFYKPSYYVGGWAQINVPGNWERQGYGTPIYVNETYEFDDPMFKFKKNPPLVPHDSNEVGSYRRSFTIPANWENRRVVLCCEGATSFYYVWVNGQLIGYNQGSKTPAEWDITQHLQPGENTIAMEVYRWSAASYLECQDMWRMSGIERDVYLYSTPQTHIADFEVTSKLDTLTYEVGQFGLDIEVAGDQTTVVEYTLQDQAGKEISSGKINSSRQNRAMGANRVSYFTLPEKAVDVLPWSAEHPNLYSLVLELEDKNGKTLQTTGCQVGFRTSEIKNGQFMVNGKPILVKGVNRHEHSQKGRTVSRDLMRKDIELMKLNNINTVRNSHYPTDPYWYELCNEYGLYMIDEANIESHGMGYGPRSLAKDSTWIPAHMDRTRRMYERSKNHPAIVIWSLGNEAGNGICFERTYDWLKSVEQDRPVQYERAVQNYNTDIVCPMYRPLGELKAYTEQEDPKVYRPYILCEYLHTMGNSGGALKEYMDLFESEPLLQGGCIWDWVDQSFIEIDSQGKWFYTYGGDYGPKGIPTFDNFCCNGLVNSQREANPHLLEVKKNYQYIKAQLKNERNLTISIKNWHDFTNLNEYTLYWTVEGDNGAVIAKGEQIVEALPQATVEISLGKVAYPKGIKEAFVNLSWKRNQPTAMIPLAHEVAYDQFTIVRNKRLDTTPSLERQKVDITIDPATGGINSYLLNGKEMLSSPMLLSIYRPITDNDNREKKGGAKAWRKAGLDNITQKALSIEQSKNGGNVKVALLNASQKEVGRAEMKYRVDAQGVLSITSTFVPNQELVTSMARLGLVFTMPDQYKEVTYLGRGDHETYIDRNQSGKIGIWQTDAEKMFHYYVKPQSTGNRTDVRWMELTNQQGDGFYVKGGEAFQFSVSPFEDVILDKAKHINELQRTGIVTVHLDALQSGVGTATCGPGVLPQYCVPIEKHSFEFTLYPLQGN